jgi:hypothetical protein
MTVLSMRPLLAVGLLLGLQIPVVAQPSTGTVEMHVVGADGVRLAGATVRLLPISHAGAALSARLADDGRPVLFVAVPAGQYRVVVAQPGFEPAERELHVTPDEHVSLRATLVPARPASGPDPQSTIALADRYWTPDETLLGEDRLRDLPRGDGIWSLIDTADGLTIADRIDNGGLWTGEPLRLGRGANSWTETSYRFGDVDVTDPDETGTPLLYPDPAAMQVVAVESSLMPVEQGAPGVTVTLVPKRPGSVWHGTFETALTPHGGQAHTGGPEAPSVARFGSSAAGRILLSGPVVKDKLGLLVSARLARTTRFERADPLKLKGDAASFLAHLVYTPAPGNEIRVVAASDAVSHPFTARLRFAGGDVSEDDTFWHLQGTWDRRAPGGEVWSVTASYQRGVFSPVLPPPAGASTAAGTVDSVFDGPVSALWMEAPGVHQRWDLAARVYPTARELWGYWHVPRFGLELTRSRSEHDGFRAPPIAELVAGIPARIWTVSGGEAATWASTELVAWAADRIAVRPRLSLEGGLRLSFVGGSASGADNSIAWRTVSPRVSARWQPEWSRGLSFSLGYGRYHHRLPLNYFACGDPQAPAGWVYRWNETDRDGVFQPREIGALIARVGPGWPVNSIDPGIRRPHTDELVIGIDRRFGHRLAIRVTGLDRRERDLVEPVNVGVTAADYSTILIPDRGPDWMNGTDSRLLPVYNRLPASFGGDRHVLTNVSEHRTRFQAIDVTVEKSFASSWQMLFSATAHHSRGMGANPGFLATENDQGVIGELFADPNALTYASGRLFFDRGYVAKWSASYHGPHDVRLGMVARYEDGQHFARVVVVPDLNQGPEAVQAYDRGLTRFTYTFTLDARLEKGMMLASHRVVGFVEAFNLFNKANEVEENPVTGPSFRVPTAVQPPRALRIGVRVDF